MIYGLTDWHLTLFKTPIKNIGYFMKKPLIKVVFDMNDIRSIKIE